MPNLYIEVFEHLGIELLIRQKMFYADNHSLKNPDVNQTSLSNHIRKLKEVGIKHTIQWEQIDQARSFSPVTGICGLCTKEKFHITFKPRVGPLNKKVRCSVIVDTREESYFVATQTKTQTRAEAISYHHLNFVHLTHYLVSDDCTCYHYMCMKL